MRRLRKPNTSFLVALPATLFLISCLPTFEHSIDLSTIDRVDPEPYLGQWNLAEWGGEAPPFALSVAVAQGATQTLNVEFELSGQPVSEVGFLTQVDDQVIAAMRHSQSGFWDVVQCTLKQGGNRVILRPMKAEKLKEDVAKSILPGILTEIAGFEDFRVTAEGPELRSYIEKQTDLFQKDPVLVLEKVQP